jgi:ADP-heptose:LPS heptosyltransferase
MRLLFIAPADPGETVLATGVLGEMLTHAQPAHVTVVCAPVAEALFRAVPGLEALHLWPRGGGFRAGLGLARTLSGRRFDAALDLSGSHVARLVSAQERVMSRKGARLDDWSMLVGQVRPLAPKIWLDARAQEDAAAIGTGAFIALAPGAAHPGMRWPADRFAAVARRLANGPLAEATMVLLGGVEDKDTTRVVANSLDADGVGSRDLAGKLDLLAQAALLQHATLFIGNDNTQLQLAAAMKAPTLGLFGASDDRVRAPFGVRARVLRARAYEAVMAISTAPFEDRSLMQELSVDRVEAAAGDLLRMGGLG